MVRKSGQATSENFFFIKDLLPTFPKCTKTSYRLVYGFHEHNILLKFWMISVQSLLHLSNQNVFHAVLFPSPLCSHIIILFN